MKLLSFRHRDNKSNRRRIGSRIIGAWDALFGRNVIVARAYFLDTDTPCLNLFYRTTDEHAMKDCLEFMHMALRHSEGTAKQAKDILDN